MLHRGEAWERPEEEQFPFSPLWALSTTLTMAWIICEVAGLAWCSARLRGASARLTRCAARLRAFLPPGPAASEAQQLRDQLAARPVAPCAAAFCALDAALAAAALAALAAWAAWLYRASGDDYQP
ncbi:hypothetical protein R5R35_012609 [Gryllus longicercus]|uniref:Uncharacterized protein n=1 Tax=Gryllus longicercus TaxID=2509291 RepID=A0AAN9V9I4_9ORTH